MTHRLLLCALCASSLLWSCREEGAPAATPAPSPPEPAAAAPAEPAAVEPAVEPAVAEPIVAEPAAEPAAALSPEDLGRAQRALKLPPEASVGLLALGDGRELAFSAPQGSGELPGALTLALLEGDKELERVNAAPFFAAAPPELREGLKGCDRWAAAVAAPSGRGGALLTLTCARTVENTDEFQDLVAFFRWNDPPASLEKLRPTWIGAGSQRRREGAGCAVGFKASFRVEGGALVRARAGFASGQGAAECAAPADQQDSFSF